MSWKHSIATLPAELLGLAARAARRCAPRNRSLYWLVSGDPNYLLWLLHHKHPLLSQPAAPPNPTGPLFSILMPVFNTRADWLREAIDSVCRQTFGAWELVIVDDASSTAATRRVLAEAAALEARIRLLCNATNRGIAASTNRAAQAAQGRYLVLLDHDDTLYPDALARFARAIGDTPGVRLLYADEDRLTAAGLRQLHDFKPAFSPSLLEMCNYILHPLCLRRDLWQTAGGLCSRFDGSQDYDLLLRLVDAGEQPVHVPGILYSWRQGASSMAGGAAKPHIYRAGRAALQDHLARRAESGDIADNPETGPGDYRIRFRLPQRLHVLLVGAPAAAVVAGDWQITRLATASDPATALAGLEPARFDAVVWLTPALATADWTAALGELIGWARRRDVGVVGGRLLTPAGRILHAGLGLTSDQRLRADFAGRPLSRTAAACRLRDCLALAPGALAIAGAKLAVLSATAPLPPPAWSLALCLAARERGWRVVYTPFASFQTTRPPDLPDPAAVRDLLDHYAIKHDPYTNPWLTSPHWNDLRLPLQWPPLDRLAAVLWRRLNVRALRRGR